MNIKRWQWVTALWLLLAACLIFNAGAGNAQAGEVTQKPVRVTVLFFNDLHGHLMPFTVEKDNLKVEMGGIARMAALIDKIREENRKAGVKTIVLIAGDILQGTPLSTVFKGQPDVECLNEMRVDALTVGNHEFDFGLDNFLALRKAAKFPFLSANIVWRSNGRRLTDAVKTCKLSSRLTLTVIGITTRDLLTTTAPANVEKLNVYEPLPIIRPLFAKAKTNGPVILLSHSRHETDRAIAETLPGLAAIIGGHDQILLEPCRMVGDVPILEAFEKGKYLGRLDLTVDPVSKQAKMEAWSYIPINAEITPQPRVAAIVERYNSRMDAQFKEILGEASVFLDGERERIRYEETTLGNFVTDIMRAESNADIAFINSGSLRASIAKGPVSVETVFKMMPYPNELVVLELTGREIEQALTRSVQGSREEEDGGFMHVSGFKFKVRGKKVEDIQLSPMLAPLDPEKTYKVAITDFMASGGDGYTVFLNKPAVKTGLPLRELVVNTIRRQKIVSAQVEGRIERTKE